MNQTSGLTMAAFTLNRDKLGLLCLALLASTSVHFARADEPKTPEDANRAIRSVLDKQVAAWNKGDLEAFMAGYWKSPKLSFSSGNNKVEGWQATFDRYKQRYQSEGREMGQLSFTDLEIESLGPDSAFVRGRFKLKTSKDNPTGIFTLIFRKFPQGWLIVHDHTSS